MVNTLSFTERKRVRKNFGKLKEVSKLNIHFISLGELTKNIKSIDFSLLLKKL